MKSTIEILNNIGIEDGCGDWLGMMSYYSDTPKYLTLFIQEAMIIFAQQAIIEDRKNVAENAVILFPLHHLHGTKNVDKDSIINAPKLELK